MFNLKKKKKKKKGSNNLIRVLTHRSALRNFHVIFHDNDVCRVYIVILS